MVMRITSRGPVLYVHQRVGRGGKPFRCYKLRTMVVNAHEMQQSLQEDSEHQNDKTFKMRKDPRVTKLGYFLRRYSLDEVPQLLNVLLGDMSLVGPRPPIPSEVELYSDFDMQRLRVKPGLTCIWQVSGTERTGVSGAVGIGLAVHTATQFSVRPLAVAVHDPRCAFLPWRLLRPLCTGARARRVTVPRGASAKASSSEEPQRSVGWVRRRQDQTNPTCSAAACRRGPSR